MRKAESAVARVVRRIGFGLLALFMVPFMAFGLAMFRLGFSSARQGQLEAAAFAAAFGAVFCGIPIEVLASAGRSERERRQDAVMAAAHPEAPWLWREDWASGRISHFAPHGSGILMVFAAGWNAIAWIMVYAFVRDVSARGWPTAGNLLMLLFPVIGIVIALRPVRLWLHHARYGESVLELDSVPGVIGGQIAGIVRARAQIAPARGFAAELSCLRRSGDSESTTEEVLWKDAVMAHGTPTAEGTAVRFALAIPPDAIPTTVHRAGYGTFWRLTIRARAPGVDYAPQFDVPVFRTAESPQRPESESFPRSSPPRGWA